MQSLIFQILARKAHQMMQISDILQALATSMIARLELLKFQPDVILDCGSGVGIDSSKLAEAYPNATILALDPIHELHIIHRQHTNIIDRQHTNTTLPTTIHYIRGDARSLPLSANSIDLYYSNLMLPYIEQPLSMITEMLRALKPAGRFLIAGLGASSFSSLKKLGLSVAHVMDVSAMCDMLLTAGAHNPVIDIEYIQLEYTNVDCMLQDLRLVGCGAVLAASPTQFTVLRKLLKDNTACLVDLELVVAAGEYIPPLQQQSSIITFKQHKTGHL